MTLPEEAADAVKQGRLSGQSCGVYYYQSDNKIYWHALWWMDSKVTPFFYPSQNQNTTTVKKSFPLALMVKKDKRFCRGRFL